MAKASRSSFTHDESRKLKQALIKSLAKKDHLGVTNYEHVANALVRNAMLGKEASIAMVFDRMEGKVTNQPIVLEDGGTVGFRAIEIRTIWPQDQSLLEAEEAEIIDVTPNKH